MKALGFGAVLIVLLLGPSGARAEDEEGGVPAAPTFRELLGDLAEVADEVGTLYPVTAPAPAWVDDLVDLSSRDRMDERDRERSRRVIEGLRAYAAADRLERLGRQAAHNVALDPSFGACVHATLWEPPFLVVHTDGSRLSDLEFLTHEKRSPGEAAALRARIREKQASWLPVLRRYASVASFVHAQMPTRFGRALGLRPLSDPYGGGPDVPAPLRTFADGVPLVLLVFGSAQAVARHDLEVSRSERTHSAYFDPRTGRGITHADGTEGEQARRAAFVVAAQLLHWYSRQRRQWKHPSREPDALRIGLASWLAGLVVDAEGGLRFTGVDPDLLEGARAVRDALAKEERPYPTISLRTLFGSHDLFVATAQAVRESGMAPEAAVALVWQQTWAFVLFLDEARDVRRTAFEHLVDGTLSSRGAAESFRAAFPEPTWPALEAEFRTFLTEDLLRRDPARYREPPAATLPR